MPFWAWGLRVSEKKMLRGLKAKRVWNLGVQGDTCSVGFRGIRLKLVIPTWTTMVQ